MRVSGRRPLWEGDEVGLGLAGSFQVFQDFDGVAWDVPYGGVDLCPGQAKRPCHVNPRLELCRVYNLPNVHANR